MEFQSNLNFEILYKTTFFEFNRKWLTVEIRMMKKKKKLFTA